MRRKVVVFRTAFEVTVAEVDMPNSLLFPLALREGKKW